MLVFVGSVGYVGVEIFDGLGIYGIFRFLGEGFGDVIIFI